MTVDTNIVIAWISGEKLIDQLMSEFLKNGGFLYLPSVVEAETLSYERFTDQEIATIEDFFENNFLSIPLERTLARLAGEIRREHKMKLPDAAIAATALFTRTPLITRNHKDFQKIKGLEVMVI